MFNFKIKTMQKLFLFLTLAVSCITSYAQTNVHKNAREFRKMTEISSVVTLNNYKSLRLTMLCLVKKTRWKDSTENP